MIPITQESLMILKNVSKRMNMDTIKIHIHNKRRPLLLEFYQEFNDVLQAIYFEKKIKGWSRAKKYALINEDFDMLQILSECRNATHYKYDK